MTCLVRKPAFPLAFGSFFVVSAGAALLALPAAGLANAAQPPPSVAASNPRAGASDVDPALAEIRVTFDRDMGKGMSWTGGPPLFPPLDESRKPQWIDARTCVLPVKLAAAKFYRVGINSTTNQNFRAADGAAAPPSVIYFTTKGAGPDVLAQLRVPEIVKIEPINGATDVDPKTAELRVTFNIPMNEGMSWVGGGPAFPKLPEGKKASWSSDGHTCTLPVVLEPGRDYELGLNSRNHNNFQSHSGVPLAPVAYRFRTRALP